MSNSALNTAQKISFYIKESMLDHDKNMVWYT